MSAREWKPGDVAIFAVDRWPLAATWPDDTSQVVMRLDKDGRYWNAIKGDPARPFRMSVYMTDYYHPLVVIDPEDREEVGRFRDALDPSQTFKPLTQYQAAFRSLVGSPNLEEPTGLGAVVECEDGAVWVRTDVSVSNRWVRAGFGTRAEWSNIDVVKVLSEGVTP